MKRLLYIFSFFLFFAASYGRAQTAGQAELLAQRENIAPGQEFYLALELTLPRGRRGSRRPEIKPAARISGKRALLAGAGKIYGRPFYRVRLPFSGVSAGKNSGT